MAKVDLDVDIIYNKIDICYLKGSIRMKYLNKIFIGVMALLFSVAALTAEGCGNLDGIFTNADPTPFNDEALSSPATEFPQTDATALPSSSEQPYYTTAPYTPTPGPAIVTPTPPAVSPDASSTGGLSPTIAPDSFQTIWIMDGNEVETDMNFDGMSERISIDMIESAEPDKADYICKVSITMGDTGLMLFLDIYADAFCGALLHDFDSTDNSIELLVGYCVNENDYYITANALAVVDDSITIINSTINGWIEHFSDGVIMVGDMLDVLGQWGATREFTIARSAASQIEFITVSDEWLIHAYDLPGIVTLREIPARAYTIGLESTQITLPAGSVLQPSATDMETYMEFMLDDGRECIIDMDIAPDGTITIEGESADAYFEY